MNKNMFIKDLEKIANEYNVRSNIVAKYNEFYSKQKVEYRRKEICNCIKHYNTIRQLESFYKNKMGLLGE